MASRSKHADQSAWAREAADGKGPGQPDPGQAKRRFPKPLTAAELRALYARNPSPEVRALLWEVARLRTRLRRADQLRACLVQGDHITTKHMPAVLEAMTKEFGLEPCLQQDEPGGRHAGVDEELFSIGPGGQICGDW